MNGDALVFDVAHYAGPMAGATCDACNGSRLCWICRAPAITAASNAVTAGDQADVPAAVAQAST